jgi:hypothetical protein
VFDSRTGRGKERSMRASWLERCGRMVRTPGGVIALAGLVALLIYLAFQLPASVLPLLPFGILLLCPLMHLFMHRNHGHGGRHGPSGHH